MKMIWKFILVWKILPIPTPLTDSSPRIPAAMKLKVKEKEKAKEIA
jgi:hypothetical protein